MKNHAIIKNGLVSNISFADEEFAKSQGWVACDNHVSIGWSYANGVFTAPVVVVSDEELAQQTRNRRNTLLTESDWTQVADAPVDKAAWATYRQALRDIPTHANFPNLTETDWPTKPE